ncbi:hypothetical protein D9M71_480910 [compost metagenome]
MADHDRRTLLARQRDSALQLGTDGLGGAHIVEKHIPGNAGQLHGLGIGCRDSGGAGAAIDEKQMAALQFGHQPGHGLGFRCHAAAHVVVDA